MKCLKLGNISLDRATQERGQREQAEGPPMPAATMTAQPCNESWTTRKTFRCVVAAAETASERLKSGLIVSHAKPRGSSQAGSWLKVELMMFGPLGRENPRHVKAWNAELSAPAKG